MFFAALRNVFTLFDDIQQISLPFLLLAGNNVSDEQLDAMLESGQTDVFTQNVSS